MLKVGVIDYINFLPFVAAIQEGALQAPIEWVPGIPTALNKALRAGKLDVAVVSSAEYLAHRSQYQLLPDFCVGAESRVMSVCLYVRENLDEKSLSGKRVGLTSQSASSSLLVRVLCYHFWQVSPHFETLETLSELKACDAFLLIGDDCLANPVIPGYKVIDLVEAWNAATGLPFTFAVFAAQKNVDSEQLKLLRQTLYQAITWGDQHPDVIQRLAKKKCPLPADTLSKYFETLRFRFTSRQQEALQIFDKLVQRLPLAS